MNTKGIICALALAFVATQAHAGAEKAVETGAAVGKAAAGAITGAAAVGEQTGAAAGVLFGGATQSLQKVNAQGSLNNGAATTLSQQTSCKPLGAFAGLPLNAQTTMNQALGLGDAQTSECMTTTFDQETLKYAIGMLDAYMVATGHKSIKDQSPDDVKAGLEAQAQYLVKAFAADGTTITIENARSRVAALCNVAGHKCVNSEAACKPVALN